MRSDLKMAKLKQLRKGIIVAFIRHEDKRDSLNFHEGIYKPDWEIYDLTGIRTTELLKEWEHIQNQINELQN